MRRPVLPAYLAEPEPDRRLALAVEGLCMAFATSLGLVVGAVLFWG